MGLLAFEIDVDGSGQSLGGTTIPNYDPSRFWTFSDTWVGEQYRDVDEQVAFGFLPGGITPRRVRDNIRLGQHGFQRTTRPFFEGAVDAYQAADRNLGGMLPGGEPPGKPPWWDDFADPFKDVGKTVLGLAAMAVLVFAGAKGRRA